jgi:hypothetical protein
MSSSSQALIVAVKKHPLSLLQPSSVQSFWSSHTSSAVVAHCAAALHKLSVEQALLSSQTVPSRTVVAHPEALSQRSSVHAFWSSHPTGAPAVQLSSEQRSPWVQASPSSQGSPSRTELVQAPATQSSLVHKLLSSQASTAPGVHTPPMHASPSVQELPSSHGAVSSAAKSQLPLVGSHVSVVQGFSSSHKGEAPVQVPPPHCSPIVHGSPSSQAAKLFLKSHPVPGEQVSSVHGLSSTHVTAWSPRHQPSAVHESPELHAFPSSQATPSSR